jgi:imidazolonepropionase-like amidohydrolase
VFASDLVALGVDSIEHGTWLDQSALREMAKRGTAWTPTLSAIAEPPPADFPEPRRRRWEAALANVTEMLPIAARLGVTILAGTDVAGTLAGEVAHLQRLGLEPVAAATTAAREFLGRPALGIGAPADVVTYDDDPREHPEVLDRPSTILLHGRRIK